METLCFDNFKSICDNLEFVDLVQLAQTCSTYRNIINSILTEKYCAEQFIKLFGMPMIRKPKHLTFKQFWYYVETNKIKPVQVNHTFKTWVDNTVTFGTLGLDKANAFSINDDKYKYNDKLFCDLDMRIFHYLTGKTCNAINTDDNDTHITIRSW